MRYLAHCSLPAFFVNAMTTVHRAAAEGRKMRFPIRKSGRPQVIPEDIVAKYSIGEIYLFRGKVMKNS